MLNATDRKLITQLATSAYQQIGSRQAPIGLTVVPGVSGFTRPLVSSPQSPGGSWPSKCGSYPANIRHSNRSASARTSFGTGWRSTFRELVRPLTTCTTFRWTRGSSYTARCSFELLERIFRIPESGTFACCLREPFETQPIVLQPWWPRRPSQTPLIFVR